MGGPVAQLLWRRHPERVAGLVLCATAYRFVHGARERLVFGTMMATAVSTTRTGALLTRVPVASMRRWGPAPSATRPTNLQAWAAGEMRRHDAVKVMEAGQAIGSYNARRWISEVDVPTTVVLTERDRAIDPREQLKLAAAIPGAVVQPIDDGHLSCAKREFGPALLRAVDSVHTRISADRRACTG
jgi:pimeloyl-ACP methyl ester carboxylesterase